MLNRASPDYAEHVLELRKNRKLHTFVEDRLIELLNKVLPNLHPIKEPQGLAGGRNDLMLFEFSGKKVLFEVFASYTQVSRDLLILYKTDADIKIAIVVDKEVDPRVFERYLRENPDDTFPFLFAGELFEESPDICCLKLRELIAGDEDATLQRLLRTRIPRANFLDWCKQYGIEVLSEEDVKEGNISYAKLFVTTVVAKFRKQGFSRGKLKKLGQWLSNEQMLEYIFLRVNIGLNVYLYTDLEETFSIYSDIYLVDWIRAGYKLPQTFVILSLTAVVHELEDKYLRDGKPLLNPSRELSMTIGSSQLHFTKSGRVLIVNLPSEIESVVMIPPARPDRAPNEYLKLITIASPDESIEIG